MKELTLLIALAAFTTVEAVVDLWFPDYSDFFPSSISVASSDSPEPIVPSDPLPDTEDGWGYVLFTPHDESYEEYVDEQHPFNLDWPILSEERKSQLARFYVKDVLGPYDPNMRAYRPFTKADWIFFLEHYSLNHDVRTKFGKVKRFTKTDIENFDRMKDLVFCRYDDNSNPIICCFNEVYLEGLFNIAQFDANVAKVVASFIELFEGRQVQFLDYSSFISICLFKKFESQIKEYDINRLLLKAIKTPAYHDEEIASLWQNYLQKVNNYYLLEHIIETIKYKRFSLFSKFLPLYCERAKPYGNKWSSIDLELFLFFHALRDFELSNLKAFDAMQLGMINLLLVGFGEFALAAMLKYQKLLEVDEREDTQVKRLYFAYMDQANFNNLEELDDSEENYSEYFE